MKRLMIISSDSHAAPPMADFRPYLEERYLEEFDSFLIEYQKRGSRNFEPPALKHRLDPEEVASWEQKMVKTGRLQGASDLEARCEQMAIEGIAGEIVFPDFGRPFEMVGSPIQASYVENVMDREHLEAGNRAYNRWLAHFVQESGPRFAAMAPCNDWSDMDNAIEQMGMFKEAGFKGIVLPRFDREHPLFHPIYEPIWSALEEMGLVVNIHPPMSSITTELPRTAGAPHPGAAAAMFGYESMFNTRSILAHLIWGGVLERHPRLKVVFTEMGSGWTIAFLEQLDYSYMGSYLRTDVRQVIRSKPSEYFRAQCYIGSSVFSRAEVGARHQIGVDRMMIGMDYPHHEGTVGGGTREYLRATFGAELVPEAEARRMLGETAASVFGFDIDALEEVAEQVGPLPSEVLIEPEFDYFPRGDVKKPLSAFF